MSDLFSVGVVAHDSRRAQAKALGRKLKAFVSVDDGTLGCTGNHIAVLRHLSEMDIEWCVVLEDDAVPVAAPLKHITAALTNAPSDIVSFYLGTNYPTYWQPGIARAVARADAGNACWITSPHLLHAVAYAVQREHVPSLLAFLECAELPIDEAITAWAMTKRRGVGYTWPCLFDHLDDPTVLVHKDGIPRTLERKAHRHGVPAACTKRTVELEY